MWPIRKTTRYTMLPLCFLFSRKTSLLSTFVRNLFTYRYTSYWKDHFKLLKKSLFFFWFWGDIQISEWVCNNIWKKGNTILKFWSRACSHRCSSFCCHKCAYGPRTLVSSRKTTHASPGRIWNQHMYTFQLLLPLAWKRFTFIL